jgi:hypothetical protein
MSPSFKEMMNLRMREVYVNEYFELKRGFSIHF